MDAQLYAWSGGKWAAVTAQEPSTDAVAAASGFNTNAFLLGYNGSAWDRLRTSSLGATIAAGLGALAVGSILYGWDGSNYSRLAVEAAATPNLRVALYSGANTVPVTQLNADALAATAYGLAGRSHLYGYNGTTWDRVRTSSLATNLPFGVGGLSVGACLYGRAGSDWRAVEVASSTYRNLKVSLYYYGNVIKSGQGNDDYESATDHALETNTRMYAFNGSTWSRIRCRQLGAVIVAGGHTQTVGACLYAWGGTYYNRLIAYAEGALKVARGSAGLSRSGVLSADTTVKASAGDVYWLTVSDSAGLEIELNDSTDGAGTDQWAMLLPAGGYLHAVFDPPLPFAAGIYLDVSTATCKVVIGYL